MNTSSAQSAAQPYFPALTGLRAIAAFLVFGFHYNPFPVAGAGWRPLAHRVVNELHIGVTIFFVLSGFLICYRYYDAVAQRRAGWLPAYFINRFARIYPLYFLLTVGTFALFMLQPARYEPTYDGLTHAAAAEQLQRFLLNATLLKGLFSQYKFSGIAQGWSLTVEECFYAGAPWFILVFRRTRWAFIGLSCCTLGLLAFLCATIGQLDWHGLFTGSRFTLNYTFPGRCVEFFAGMALAVLVLKQQRTPGAARGRRCTLAGSLLLGACLLLLAYLGGEDNSKDHLSGMLVNNVVVAGAVCLLLYGLLAERTWLSALLSTRLMGLLGRSSYAFYLIHLGVFSILLRTYLTADTVLTFGAMNVAAILLYKGVELPLYRWLRRAA